jgi:hypothetical protein
VTQVFQLERRRGLRVVAANTDCVDQGLDISLKALRESATG